MKNVITLIILTLFCSQSFGQTTPVRIADIKVPFRIKVTESAEVYLGKNWDYSYQPMRSPMIVAFLGDKLYMDYASGTSFTERPVSNYTVIEQSVGLSETKSFILESPRDGITEYIVITISDDGFDLNFTVKYPYMNKGEVTSYIYYSGSQEIK